MAAGGAGSELVAVAERLFAKNRALKRACDALHRNLTDDGFDYETDLCSKALGDDGARVLAWFLKRNTSCAHLRCGLRVLLVVRV